MLNNPKKLAIALLLPIFYLALPIVGYCQPVTPTQQQISEILPNVVDPTQMTKSTFEAYFKDNNQKKNVAGDKNKETPNIKKELENKSLDKDSTQNDNIKKNNYRPDETYGANVFTTAAMFDISELSTPPLDYPIGVGDHIIVSLWGGGEYQEDYLVAKDGAIFPASLGKITVQGLTFENAQSMIRARFSGRVPVGTNIQVTLGQPRTVNVNVVGEVANPGPKTVSAFSNAFNLIGLAGGVTEFGNLREIQIKRNGKVVEELDVYKYLTSGDMGRKLYLQNNDFIVVGFVEKRVLATGQFKRPMYYQLKPKEGIKALIRYSGGFTADAFTSGIKVIRTENERQVIHDVNATAVLRMSNQDYLLQDGDIIKADLIRPGIVNKIELEGAVAYPGNYELRPGDRLFDVINRAGGITNNTYLPRAYVFRGAGDSTNIKSNKLEINLTDFSKEDVNSVNNVLMQANDVVHLFSNSEFGEQQFVEIYGEVRKPGTVRKYGGMTLQDLIYLSGGLKPSAEYGRLEISSIVDMDSAKLGIKPTRTVIKSYAIQSNLELDSVAAKVILKPYDQIHVRKNPSFELQENIRIEGLVNYPGQYPRLDKQERLSSYIERAGGVKENANIAGVMLFRKRSEMLREKIAPAPTVDSAGNPIPNNTLVSAEEPVSIDLYMALKNKNSRHDIILQKGDLLIVPEINPFVSVQGKVQSPLKIAFEEEHKNLSYYIDKAGGYGIRPWRSRIYVTYANGKSKRTKNFFFMHFYPHVEEGCTINVPERPETKEFGDIVKQSAGTAVPLMITYLVLKLLK
ncbi:MAG: hypothetical protein RLY16_2347 [Bacteroidota bacterium]|jgi:protein involved in polysaccharide export with SLBB domain